MSYIQMPFTIRAIYIIITCYLHQSLLLLFVCSINQTLTTTMPNYTHKYIGFSHFAL